jgi:S1/P1 Nuclease.
MFSRNSSGRLTKAMACLSTFVCLTTMMPGQAMAWSRDGHQITALIAYLLLTPRAQKNVLAVLQGKKIIAVSTWPDDIKRAGKGCVTPGVPGCSPEYRPETNQWHFVDIPFEQDKFDPQADYCRSTRYGDCIIPAIEDFRDILNKSTKRAFAANGDEQKRKLHDALSFIVHFLGDLHQPLHCAERNHDAGGNLVLVTWEGEPKYEYDPVWNLHSVWDSVLVERNIMLMPADKRTIAFYAKSLFDKLSQSERDYAQLKSSSIESGRAENVIAWAESSHALAKSGAYHLPSKTVKTSTRGLQKKNPQGQPLDIVVLDEKYFTDNMPVVENQLQLGGVRLARILNEIYDKDIPSN